MKEIIDKKTGAILFKQDPESILVERLEKKVRILENKVERLESIIEKLCIKEEDSQ